MLSSGQQAAEFIKLLAPTVKAVGLDIKLTCCDATGCNAQEKLLPGAERRGSKCCIGIDIPQILHLT